MLLNFTQLQQLEYLSIQISKEEKEKVISQFILKALQKTEIKKLATVHPCTLQLVRDYLSNIIAKNSYNAIIDNDKTMGKDEKELYKKAIRLQCASANKPLNDGMRSMHSAYLKGNCKQVNFIYNQLFDIDYDICNLHDTLLSQIVANNNGIFIELPLATFKKNIIALTRYLIVESGVKVEGKKFDINIKNIIEGIVKVKKSEMNKEATVRAVALAYNIDCEDNYIELVKQVEKLYKNGSVIIIDDTNAIKEKEEAQVKKDMQEKAHASTKAQEKIEKDIKKDIQAQAQAKAQKNAQIEKDIKEYSKKKKQAKKTTKDNA